MVILKRLKIALVVITLLVVPIASITRTPAPVEATSPFCTTAKCKAAEAAEAAARQKVEELNNSARTLETEVARLDAEIATLVASINTNQAIADDLAADIAKNQAILTEQQDALVNVLVDMHFTEEPDAILVLVGSSSIGDFAEKQARMNTVKEQISASADAIKTAKEKLERDKLEVDRRIAAQQEQRQEINAKRAEQANLIAKYRNDSSAYGAEAERQRQAKEAEMEIARQQLLAQEQGQGGAGTVVDFNGVGIVNTYGQRAGCPGQNLAFIYYGGYVCQCTSYAGWKVYEHWGVRIGSWGNANTWAEAAAARNYRVDNQPAPNTVAVTKAGPYGHVMWVESINPNGTINLTEYNYAIEGEFNYRAGVRASLYSYIHFD